MLRYCLTAAAIATLAACSSDADKDQGAQISRFTETVAQCGIEQQKPMVWGHEVSDSGLKVQEVRDGVRNLRVWSKADAPLANEDGVLTATVTGPAWIAADLSGEKTKTLVLLRGEVRVHVAEDRFECEENAELAAQLVKAENMGNDGDQMDNEMSTGAGSEQVDGPAENAAGAEQESEEQ